jgi:hypothetical protein
MANAAAVDQEIGHLVEFIKRLGAENAGGEIETTFGALFKDDELQNTLESLAGTLKAAKKRGIVKYKPELLLQGMSDKEPIVLVKGN